MAPTWEAPCFGRSAGPRVMYRRFDYVVVDLSGGDLGTRPISEKIGGTDSATVSIRPRLERGEVLAVAYTKGW